MPCLVTTQFEEECRKIHSQALTTPAHAAPKVGGRAKRSKDPRVRHSALQAQAHFDL